jgi:hypothetical protein
MEKWTMNIAELYESARLLQLKLRRPLRTVAFYFVMWQAHEANADG